MRMHPQSKLEYLLHFCKHERFGGTPTVVFCKTPGTVTFVTKMLQSCHVRALQLTAQVPVRGKERVSEKDRE